MPTTITLSVSESEDDAREGSDGSVIVTATSTIVDAVDEFFGIRFRNVQIPQGIHITEAILGVVPSGTLADQPDHPIYCEAADDAAVFTTDANNISSRSRTSATVTWSSTDLGSTGSSRHYTPNLSALVQEVVNR